MRKKILVIDDVEDTRKLLRLVLERGGYTVVEAEDGNDGLKKAQEEPFDLIITDIEMPGIDGYTLVQQLKSSRPTGEIPIIVSSAHGKLKGMFGLDKKTGIQSFIEKPFIADEIIEKVNKILK